LTPPKIIFVHIPKTAGVSVTEYLCGFYEPGKIYSGKTMLDYQNIESKSLVNFDLLKGHIFFHYIEHNQFLENHQLITVLRHPVERVISLYRFWRSHTDEFAQDTTLHPAIRGRVVLAKTLSLHDFVHSDELMILNSICNSQARQLSSSLVFETFHQQSTNAIYQNVLANLQRFSIVGLIDYLAEFYQRLNQQFGFKTPAQTLRRNVGKTDERLWDNAGEQQLIASKIIDLNQVDMQLYEHFRAKQLRNGNSITLSS
jgi:hypothetical protein